ncbi:hypothetical protein PHLCEN_2v9660 [Hermanssonia centrifuga]|uniref:Uncharacterized protein n=1 Tax=Hermanssonia centrifuga TaxID=98765 RepID=A0A2R6NQX5_9APHY|nr:hypothetical protein PHLCEN_2v9660 [Hermanssonia centrifuga]
MAAASQGARRGKALAKFGLGGWEQLEKQSCRKIEAAAFFYTTLSYPTLTPRSPRPRLPPHPTLAYQPLAYRPAMLLCLPIGVGEAGIASPAPPWRGERSSRPALLLCLPIGGGEASEAAAPPCCFACPSAEAMREGGLGWGEIPWNLKWRAKQLPP